MKKNEHVCPSRERLGNYFIKMKLLLLLIVISCMQVSAAVFSQNTKISLSVNNADLSEVFDEIERITNISFLYVDDEVFNIKGINIDSSNEPVSVILDKCLESTDLTYCFCDNTIVISPKEGEINKSIDQKKITIKGNIKDEGGNPLTGVFVTVKGSCLGTSTDIEGNFSLTISDMKKVVLLITYVGMEDKEVEYKGQEFINIRLKELGIKLDDFVVTGYQTLSKERVTGSFASVNFEKLDRKITTDFTTKLQGEVSGLQVNRDGKMTIRGISTLNADKEPLIVVDGFPIESGSLSVNPNDIKSVNVLKDAAAASIWGVRASNGVIVITTKRGEINDTPIIDFSYDFTITDKPRYEKMGYASASDAIDAELETIKNGWFYGIDKNWNSGAVSQVAEIVLGSKNYLGFSMLGKDPYSYLSKEEIAKIEQFKKEDGIEEFKKHFIRNNILQRYNLSIKGGNEKINYFISGVYNKNNKELIGNDLDDVSLNSKLNIKLNNYVDFSSGITYTNRTESSPYTKYGSFSPFFAYGKYLDNKGNYIPFPNYLAQMIKDEYNKDENYLNWNYNPLQDFKTSNTLSKVSNIRLYTKFNFKLTNDLNFNLDYQYEKSSNSRDNSFKKDNFTVRNSYNIYTGINPSTGEIVHSFPNGEILESSNSYKLSNNIRFQANYKKDFSNSSLNVLTGVEYRNVFNRGTTETFFGYESNLLSSSLVNWKLINDRNVPTWNGSRYSSGYYYRGPSFFEFEERYLSAYLNAGYNLSEKYDITFSGRLDDSNLFGASKSYRLLPLWSVGGGWNITKEDFFYSDVFNLLRLKLTYGFNGNIDRTTVPQMKAIIFKDTYTNKTVAEISNPGNPELKWEKTAVTNASLEYSILSGRISGVIEYYKKYSTDLLGEKYLNPIFGYKTVKANVARVLNEGFELELKTIPIKSDKLYTDLSFNVSYNKNTVKEVYSNAKDLWDVVNYGIYLKEGRPINSGYVYRWAGLSSEGKPLVYDKDGNKVSELANIVENIPALKYIGPIISPWNANVNTTISYSGFSLYLLFSGQFGGHFKLPRLNYISSTTFSYGGNIISNEVAKRWRKPGDELITNVPKIGDSSYDYDMNYYNNSDLKVRSSDYISFREISLSYALPSEICKKTYFSGISLTTQVRNIYKWVKNKEGLDPEGSDFTYGSIMYPTPMTLTFGLKLTL